MAGDKITRILWRLPAFVAVIDRIVNDKAITVNSGAFGLQFERVYKDEDSTLVEYHPDDDGDGITTHNDYWRVWRPSDDLNIERHNTHVLLKHANNLLMDNPHKFTVEDMNRIIDFIGKTFATGETLK